MTQNLFKQIYTSGEIVFENPEYAHIYDVEMPLYYDANFITLKLMPTIEAFEKIEMQLIDFHKKRNQQHVKFYFPPNETLTDQWKHFLKDKGYEIGLLELYELNPAHFKGKSVSSVITIQAVNDANYSEFDKLQYEQDIEFGIEFADLKRIHRKKDYLNEHKLQIIAFYEDQAVGNVDVLLTQQTAEIDNLHVLEAYRKQGIGSALQQFAIEEFPNKTFILVADGEDTAREMYQKQNYECTAFQYEILKTSI